MSYIVEGESGQIEFCEYTDNFRVLLRNFSLGAFPWI